ncbi:50S ribosomal protein L21 [candidate division KSB1 bacterium]
MDFAVVEISGKQFEIREQEEIEVPKLQNNVGDTIELANVLLLHKGGNTDIGTPLVDSAKVKATVIKHDKGKKVTVFKKKRRKDYKKTVGFREEYSVIRIEAI